MYIHMMYFHADLRSNFLKIINPVDYIAIKDLREILLSFLYLYPSALKI